MSLSRRSYKQLLLWLIEGSRGGVNRGRIIEAIKAGVNNYVVKPFTPETLMGKINETMQKVGQPA